MRLRKFAETRKNDRRSSRESKSRSALRPVSLICGAGRDRAPSRAGQTPYRRSLAGSGGQPRQSPGSCGATPLPEAAAWSIAQRQQWHAGWAARRPKQGKLALKAALQAYVEERLAGVGVAPSGVPVPGTAMLRVPADPAVERPSAWTAARSAVGNRLEPGADRPPPTGRLSRR